MGTLTRGDEVSAGDRFDFVRDISATTWVPIHFQPEHCADYWGQFRATGPGAMQVVVFDVMPVTVRRTPGLISQAGPGQLKLLLVRGGGRRESRTTHDRRYHSASRHLLPRLRRSR
jgi:hypothetical protein